MLCLNCGREVPFIGRVCPWCGADKIQSKKYMAFGMFFGFIGAFIGAGIGWIIGGVVGVIIGGFIGTAIGSIIGFVKGMAPATQNVICPNCGSTLTANPADGPNFVCPHCTRTFRA